MSFVSKISEARRSAFKLLGSSIVFMFALTVPIGLALGAGEILFGAALYEMLIYFSIVPPMAITNLPFTLSTIGNPVVVIVMLAATVMILRFLGITLPNIAAETLSEKIRIGITNNVMTGTEEKASFSVSDVSHILSNLSPATANFLFSISRLVVDVSFLIVIMMGMTFLSPNLSLLTLGLSFVIAAPMLLMRKVFSSYSIAMHEDIRFFTHRLIKDVKNIQFLKVTGMNERERTKITDVSRRFFKNVLQFRTLTGIYSVFPQFLGVIAGVSIIYLNQRFEFSELSVLVPFMYLLTRITGAISSLSSTVAQLLSSKPHAMEFFTYAEHFSNLQDDAISQKNEINNITDLIVADLGIGRSEQLLPHLTFSASRGQTLLISGASGRGKTTLLMTLIGFVRRLSGEISWNGTSLDLIRPEDLRRFVGYAGPDPYLINGSIRENILFGVEEKSLTNDHINKALWCARAEFVDTLDGALSYQLIEDGDGISAGQKQRLSLARALLCEPDLLLLDEATANIDEAMEEEIMIRIRKTFPDIIIIAVSHRSSMKKFATELIYV